MTYRSEVLADSPWGFWEQAETSGTTLADSSGNARSLSITGSPSLAQVGPDGSTADAIQWPAASASATTSQTTTTSTATVETWLYLSAAPAANTMIAGPAQSDSVFDKVLYVDTAGKVGFYVYLGGGRRLITAAPVALNAWHHIIGSVGAAGMKLVIDKTLEASDVAVTGSYTGAQSFAVRIGLGVMNGGYGSLNGQGAMKIARPAFYTTQLSDARAYAHYDAVSGGGGGGAGAISLAGTLPAIQSSLTVAVRVGTATSNRANGRQREGVAYVTDTTPPEPMPANLVRAQRVVKAIAYPPPTLDNGRPT